MTRTSLVPFVSTLLVAVISGCSGEESSNNSTGDQDAADAADGAAADLGDGDASDSGGDAADSEADPQDGGTGDFDSGDQGDPFGSVCENDGECASSLCVRFDLASDEGFCSSYCFEATDCPSDSGGGSWDCVFLRSSGNDGANLCVPNDLCIDGDSDEYGLGPGCRGPDCDNGNDAVNPSADEVCDSLDNDCDGNIDENPVDANLDCETGFSGQCAAGRAWCQSGIIVCEPLRTPGDEICDGLDNDCDDLADEGADGLALTESCYAGPDATNGVGLCRAGARTCRDGRISDCEGQVLPFLELCDGLDNDCDGEADEDEPGSGVTCGTGLAGACARGRTACDAGVQTCVPETAAAPETCDGLDNDCDGSVDEDDTGTSLSRTCYEGDASTVGVGLCVAGAQTCGAGEWGPCLGDVLPEPELCDTLDNNCNGEVDEGRPTGGFICDTGLLGNCARGVSSCDESGSICLPLFEPTLETCDGLDNDCDGAVDESDADASQPISLACYLGPDGSLGQGICTEGVQTCVAGYLSSCIGQVLPAFEICDGIDNDCDGQADDGSPGTGLACSTGLPGACAVGTTLCQDGAVACAPNAEPEAERCDGVDNDCDGETDEDDAGDPLVRTCYDDDPATIGVGECREGEQTCVAGEFGPCIGDVLPEPELCDTLDNNCDGQVDEGNPSGGFLCSTGLSGICARGLSSCASGGAGTCDPIFDPEPEVCDGIDNDCDAEVDEDAAGQPISTECYQGPEGTLDVGTCAGGVRQCVGGDFSACVGQTLPEAETCDDADNDCDGAVDEGNPGGGQACSTGLSGICAIGTSFCDAGGALGCTPAVSPADEVCDGLDNDCDGLIDEDDSGLALSRDCYDGGPGTIGVGVCAGGTQACTAGDWGACLGDIVPTWEACDNLDNDCDGDIDEGDPDAGFVCSTGLAGVCARGITSCSAGVLSCDQEATPSAEICDGLDNDCDGVTDEGPSGTPLSRTCYDGPAATEGVGICAGGTQTCTGGEFQACIGDVVPSYELCDTLDNDCDGEADENNPEAGYDCDTGLLGVCRSGLTVCSGGVVSCVQEFPASGETCDGFDNDCDGVEDEDDGGDPLSRACYDGPAGTENVGVCHGGTSTCRFGDYGGCVGQVIPVTEVCDLLDNDCDVEIDEGVQIPFYIDADGDNYGAPGTQVLSCFGVPGYTQNGGDCYDDNPDANPGQSGYFSSDRGDGSFDYDCDGAETALWGGTGACRSDPPLCYLQVQGWLSTIPPCGGTDIFIFDCLGNGNNCDPTTATTTQSCR